MDILDNLISFAQISGSINIHCKFQKDWQLKHEKKRGSGVVHIVTKGNCYLKLEGTASPRKVNVGDVIFFPRSLAHILTDQPTNQRHQPIQCTQKGAFMVKECGFASPELHFFCATFRYEPYSELFNNLPEMIILNLQDSALSPLATMLEQEAELMACGAKTIVNALLNVLLVLFIRAYLKQENAQLKGILNGLRDKRLYSVISAIMERPEESWKIDDLSQRANISRAQLMRLFTQQMNISPHSFVNSIRLQKAAQLLHYSQDSILSIALNCGFQSETNFGKAFKKYYQMTPGQYRKQVLD